MKPTKLNTVAAVAALGLALGMITTGTAQADNFGTTGSEFTIDFVNIGNAGNAADTTTYGAVPYEYRISTYEISQDAIDNATASGMSNVTAGPWTGSQPATNTTWYEAAAFVNWLNTSTGHQAAYDLTFSGSWSMNLWSSGQAWTAGGENLFRHKDAIYFLPSENEWYKAAYYNPSGSNYFLYPTGSDTAPTAVASGTTGGTAVYDNFTSVPAAVTAAGGSSPYGTMGQGFNVWEWSESAFDGTNSSSTEFRMFKGGNWNTSGELTSSLRGGSFVPSGQDFTIGFRVASVSAIPEPSGVLVALALVGAGFLRWRARRSI